jgi:very-short-patch-repair endonuclease
VTRGLRQTGWKVLRIWEHELARKSEGRLWRRMRQHLAHP